MAINPVSTTIPTNSFPSNLAVVPVDIRAAVDDPSVVSANALAVVVLSGGGGGGGGGDASAANQAIEIARLDSINASTDGIENLIAASNTQLTAINANTDTLEALALPAVASGNITTQNLVPAGAATAGSVVEVTLNGRNTLAAQITGTYTGALSVQGTVDGTTWVTLGGVPIVNVATGATSATIASAAVGIFQIGVTGFAKARVTGLAAVTGTAAVSLSAVSNSALVALDASLPAGTNSIGSVTIGAALPTGSNSIGNVVASGGTPEDAATAVSPLIVGGVVRTAASPPITFVAGDAVRVTMTGSGAMVTKNFATPEADWQYAAAASGIVNTTTAVTIKAAAGASLRNYITGLQISSDALGAATEIAIRDGAAGPVLWRQKLTTSGTTGIEQIQFATPLRGTAATLLEVVTLTATVTGGVYVSAQGYVAP